MALHGVAEGLVKFVLGPELWLVIVPGLMPPLEVLGVVPGLFLCTENISCSLGVEGGGVVLSLLAGVPAHLINRFSLPSSGRCHLLNLGQGC